MSSNRASLLIVLATAVSVFSGMPLLSSRMVAFAAADRAQDDWQKEFEAVCSQSQDSMALTPNELKSLIDRCDAVRLRVEKLGESQQKVYLKRLQMCRDLLVFVLESKSGK
jgi:hypothetical protein